MDATEFLDRLVCAAAANAQESGDFSGSAAATRNGIEVRCNVTSVEPNDDRAKAINEYFDGYRVTGWTSLGKKWSRQNLERKFARAQEVAR